jgi:hypothetical protein
MSSAKLLFESNSSKKWQPPCTVQYTILPVYHACNYYLQFCKFANLQIQTDASSLCVMSSGARHKLVDTKKPSRMRKGVTKKKDLFQDAVEGGKGQEETTYAAPRCGGMCGLRGE